MMNRPIEGVVTAATLHRRLVGHSFWRDVMVSRVDGDALRFARVATATRLDHALEVGSSGRFHFHDLIGTHGLHGFTAAGSLDTVQSFPKLMEALFATLALLNLGVAAAWLNWGGVLSPIPLATGIVSTMVWAICYAARQAILHDVRFDDRLAARRTYRAAVMHSHA